MQKQAIYYRTGGGSASNIGPPYISLPRAIADKGWFTTQGQQKPDNLLFHEKI